MLITQIKKIGKGQRYSLFVDENFHGVFEAEILARYKLKTGQEIDEQFLSQLKTENGDYASFDRALNLLEHGMKSKKQVTDYLKEKGYPDDCIERAMQKLEEYGYLDDLAYAKEYIKIYSQKDGEKKLRHALKNKGIDAELIDQALASTLDQDAQKGACLNLARKKLKNLPLDGKNRQKLVAYLAGRGYNFSIIKWALAQIGQDDGEDKDDWD